MSSMLLLVAYAARECLTGVGISDSEQTESVIVRSGQAIGNWLAEENLTS